MSRKLAETLVLQAAELVKEGTTVQDAASVIGCNPDTLSLRLRALGIDTSKGKRVGAFRLRTVLPTADIVTAYNSGAGVPSIASQYGVANMTITKTLKRAGIQLRGPVEANQIVAANKTKEQHVSSIQAARKVRTDNLIGAAANGVTHAAIGFGEQEIANLLRQYHIPFVQQFPINGYLIDIAIDKIAVEIKSSAGNVVGSRATTRFEKITERGYSFLFIVIRSLAEITRHASDIIACIEQARRDPPAPGEYWMIRSALYDLSGNYEANEWTIVKYTKKPTRA